MCLSITCSILTWHDSCLAFGIARIVAATSFPKCSQASSVIAGCVGCMFVAIVSSTFCRCDHMSSCGLRFCHLLLDGVSLKDVLGAAERSVCGSFSLSVVQPSLSGAAQGRQSAFLSCLRQFLMHPHCANVTTPAALSSTRHDRSLRLHSSSFRRAAAVGAPRRNV